MMLMRPTLSLVIEGADLVWARIAHGVRGARALRGGRLERALEVSPDEARRALGIIAGRADRAMLTVPGAWCSLRPIALNVSQWPAARPEVMQSISSLLPLAPTDALVGLVERRAGETGGAGGYLVAVDRERLAPWLEWVRSVTGQDVQEIISPHMALPGLGLQRFERAEVVESQAGGAVVTHTLRRGEVVELCRAGRAGEGAEADMRLTLGGAQLAGLPLVGTPVSAEELAIAGALSARVAPGQYAPLAGRSRQGPRRWVMPAAAAAVAILMLLGASWTSDARYEARAAALEAWQAEHEAQLREVERERARTLRLVALLNAARSGPVATAPSVLPDLALAQAVLPEKGFLYRVEVDGGGVSLRGEAQRASDVLQRLESTPGFRSARMVNTPAPVEERSLETFDVRAERSAQEAER